jgi:O-antigen/teichoic acid export membrane protein
MMVSPWVSHWLKIQILPTLIFAICLPVSLVGALNTGLLQGRQSFGRTTVLGITGALGKILLAALFVWLGFAVAGVMAGI